MEHVCDGVDKIGPLIDAGNWGALLGASMRARGGERCPCAEPILTGRDLMCGCCLLENESQIQALLRAISEPHPFEVRDDVDAGSMKLRMCALCSRWDTDPRHRASSEGGE